MSQTLVLELSARDAAALGDRLTAAGFQFRHLQHARFQARGEGVTASMYLSGKLVVQGKGAQAFRMAHLDPLLGERTVKVADAGDQSGAKSVDPVQNVSLSEAHLGSDEAGKGDTFGGLCVAAVAVRPDQRPSLNEAGVTDSKRVADSRIRSLAPWIRDHHACAERVLSPAEYNRNQARSGNVNKLLTELHTEVLRELGDQTGITVAVVDRFGANLPVSRAMAGGDWVIHEVPRAEEDAAVAAASVLARDSFLAQLRDLAEHWAVDLPLGSGTPVPPALRNFLRIHGPDRLGEVAKLHFRNVQRHLS